MPAQTSLDARQQKPSRELLWSYNVISKQSSKHWLSLTSVAQLDPQIMSSFQKMLDIYRRNGCLNDELHPKKWSHKCHLHLTSICRWMKWLNEPAFGLPNLQATRSCWSSRMTPSDVLRSWKGHVITCSCHTNFKADETRKAERGAFTRESIM